MNYFSEISFAAKAPDEAFPDFLFNPIFNEFENDDYYSRGISNNPLVLKIRNLRKKYSNYFDYLDAISIYDDYMEELIDKYGSVAMIKKSAKLGLLDEILPSKPKLKNKRENREFVRAGIIPSRQILDFSGQFDLIKAARELYPNETGNEIIDDGAHKIDKKTQKRIKSSYNKIAANTRKNNIFSSAGNRQGTDMIIEFLTQANKGYYNGNTTYDGKNISISEMIKEDKKQELVPDFIKDISLEPQISYIGGKMVKTSDIRQIELIKDLYEAGLDLSNSLSKSMDKKAVKMIKRSIGITDSTPMTEKELNKLKKKSKKEQKQLERRADYDSILSETLLKNKKSIDRKGNSLSFKLRDLYNDD